MPLPFCFAWVDETDTTFGAEHQVEDEKFFAFKLDHAEAGKPTLSIDILNPRVGLLSPSRKLWAWFSWYNGSAYVPLFFGRLVGIPDSLLGETLTLILVADPPDYLARKQAVAETLKIRPFYDPVFLDAAHRDDPDAILEGWSADYHVDRTSHAVTISDRLFGEDGIVVFDGNDVFYDSVQQTLEQPPRLAVAMDATVSWTQAASGVIDFGARQFQSFSGDGLVSDWPKPLSTLQSGWSVAASSAIDTRGVGSALTASWSYSWHSTERFHEIGDTMSVSSSQSVPQINLDDAVMGVLTSNTVIGILDPYAVDSDGNPAPVNDPPSSAITKAYCPLWDVHTSLSLRYDASRSRSERVRFTMTADLQPVLSAPDGATSSEIITQPGADVGAPLLNVLNQASIRGQPVSLGQVIAVPATNDPLILNANYQICIAAGTASATEPAYSDAVGVTTVDGSVTWAGLGTTLLTDVPDWSAATSIALGRVIRPLAPLWTNWEQLLPSVPAPTVGVPVSVGRIVRRNSGASFQICTAAGTTGLVEPAFSDSRGAVTADGSAEWTCLGASLPDGASYWLCTAAGDTGDLEPTFAGGAGTVVSDGDVSWTGLGLGGNFIGVPIGDVARRSYFPTERGRWSLEYLICVARAHLLQRARAVKVAWDCPFDQAVSLSCRKNARMSDARLPGGEALGKIVAYALQGDGDSGDFHGHVEIGCAIGLGASPDLAPGDPTYVDADALVDGIQDFAGRVVLAGSADIGYSLPVDDVADDGLVFPLTRDQVVLHEEVHGTLDAQRTAIASAFAAARLAANQTAPTSEAVSLLNQQATARAGQNSVAVALKTNPIWYDLQLAPVTGQSFASEYAISLTPLSVPKMIDLGAS